MENNAKYSKEFKLDCVLRYLNGEYIETPPNTKRHTFTNKIGEWVRLYKLHGEKGLENGERFFTIEQKEQMVQEVLSGDSLTNVCIKYNTTNTCRLKHWCEIYSKYGINGLKLDERKINPFMKPKRKENDLSRLSREELEKRLLYVEAENEYLKKLETLIQARKYQQTKKKR